MSTASPRRWPRWALPAGLSLLLNGALLGVSARLLSTPPAPAAELYLAVELERTPAVRVHAPAPSKREAEITPPLREPSIERAPAPREKAVASAEKTSPDKVRDTSAAAPSPAMPRAEPRQTEAGPIHAEISGPSGPSGPGGTLAQGPGAYAGRGEGIGTSGQGESGTGTPSIGVLGQIQEHGSGRGTGTGDGQKNVSPGGEAARPAPKGESRGPVPISQPHPSYPPDARFEGVEGTVVLLASIDAGGKVSNLKVERSAGDRRLDRAAERAVKQWTYKPSLKDGVPVASSVRVRVQFRLE